MQGFLRFGLIFLGGVVVGAVAKQALSGNSNLRPMAADLLSRGMDAKDCVMGKVETLKETVEDLVAEAQSSSEKRKAEQEKANA